jgi:hypothetical protein
VCSSDLSGSAIWYDMRCTAFGAGGHMMVQPETRKASKLLRETMTQDIGSPFPFSSFFSPFS